MLQNHTMPTPLDDLATLRVKLATGSSARWARETPTHCLVFVHGYGGRAVATWGEFADMAMEDPDYAHTDLVFLGYESRSRRAAYNAGVISSAVCLLAEDHGKMMRAIHGPDRGPDFRYERIILIGHSLGGAIVRSVAQGIKRDGKPWADSLRLALFAPAHLGAEPMSLASMSLGFLSFAGALEAAAFYSSPALQDLKPNSQFLSQLLEDAKKIGRHGTTRASVVVHAADDKVVSPNIFFEDPVAISYDGQNHVSCCKPRRADFDYPVRDVTKAFL